MKKKRRKIKESHIEEKKEKEEKKKEEEKKKNPGQDACFSFSAKIHLSRKMVTFRNSSETRLALTMRRIVSNFPFFLYF